MDTVQDKASLVGFETANGAPPPPYVPQSQDQYAVQPQQVTVLQTLQTPALSLGMERAHVRCPYCQQMVLTEVTRSNTSKTHGWALVLCLVGCLPCCLIPYCCDACRGALHSCPNCKIDLGVGKE